MSADEIYMARCLDLARQGLGKTAPNPLVGSVIVKNGQIVGEGYHPQAGQPHAEIFALRQAGALAQGGTLYVNLEPCNHQGRTPPCTEAIIEAGIQRVAAGMIDPNPLVSGQGIQRLRQAGLEVTLGVMETECLRLNRAFIQRVTQRRPWGIYKYAMTLDGKIAASSGHSAWVTGEAARQRVHRLRGECEAVIVGGQTVRRDNPRLTSHGQGVKDPLRVVLSRGLDLPKEANLWEQTRAPTLVVTQIGADRETRARLEALGVEVLVLPRLTPGEVMAELYRRDCLQVLWECGGVLAAPAIADNCVQELWAFIAPKLIGGAQAPGPVGDLGLTRMTEALELSEVEIEAIGADWLIRGLLPPWQRPPDRGQ
ncbi:MAG: bifunctional diaminohydroxyphosphoribosylaminopyrimidine deaminase/5-amino-6-(5-phosphoribosylamino)uracil reductase RibD [Cyanobacteriota bacterium]|nr:bifunctional diaminohydroxyphosphoribosylaminopyrimidine deaminase/5-amino-6-(5-phosphoribosylamino)uracil reductase RibD [Cyanobacteriota bacterium]